MADVFVSYKREDEGRVAAFVAGLEAAGLSVWWDRHVEGGAGWRQAISEQLEAARCVIVVWSAASVGAGAGFVHDEAWRAKARGVLLPVAIDTVGPPLGFGEVQTLDLAGWAGDRGDPRFGDVLAVARALVAGGPRPRPRPPPLAQGSRLRRMASLAGVIAVVTGLIGFAADLAGLLEPMCRLPGARSACGQLGIGGAPGAEEEALWAARPAGDCEALRGYLARYPGGAYAAEADRRLDAARRSEDFAWTAKELRLPISVRPAPDPLASIEQAQADARRRAPEDAELACGGLRASDNRLLSVDFAVLRWDCRPRHGGDRDGWGCGFDGEAVCHIEAPSATAREECP